MKPRKTVRRERPADRDQSPNARRASAPPTGAPEVAAIAVGPSAVPEHLFRRLLGAYLSGAEEFEVRERGGISPATREVVRGFARRTRQPEVVSDDGAVLRLRDIAFESPVPLEERLTRMGRMVLDFHREAVDSWSRLPLGEDEDWERRDDEIDREAWYLQRLAALHRTTEPAGPDLLGLWTVARSLERIADHAVVLATVGPRLVDLPRGAAPSTSLRQFHAQAMEHLAGVLGERDPDAVNSLLDTGAALSGSGRSLADRLLPGVGGSSMPPATAAAVARILESIGRTIAYSQDIAQVALDRPAAHAPPRLLPAGRAGPSRRPLPERPAALRERLLTPAVP